jgi:hypothetical protein
MEPRVRTAVYMAFNFVTATCIVFVNKIVFKTYGFSYGTLMTALHFATTWLGVLACGQFGMYEVKTLAHADVFPITAAFCAFVVFQNLSLQARALRFSPFVRWCSSARPCGVRARRVSTVGGDRCNTRARARSAHGGLVVVGVWRSTTRSGSTS